MSEKGRFTPGPWAVGGQKHDDWGFVRAADGAPVASSMMYARTSDEEMVACRSNHTCPVEVEANAHLIASAPDLYDALDELRINTNRLCDRSLGGTYEHDCRRSLAKRKPLLRKLKADETP